MEELAKLHPITQVAVVVVFGVVVYTYLKMLAGRF